MDTSHGYDELANRYQSARRNVGVRTVHKWAQTLHHPSQILELGAGTGLPISKTLTSAGHHVRAIDASSKMVEIFKSNLPNVDIRCECVTESSFFNQSFDAIIAIGLIFLLKSEDQIRLIHRAADHLHVEGRFLFSAPLEAGDWTDILTGLPSTSLGKLDYHKACNDAGFIDIISLTDSGGNHYYEARLDASSNPHHIL